LKLSTIAIILRKPIMSVASGSTGWTTLRQQARTLETQTDNLFHTYSQFSTATNVPPKPSDEEREVEAKIEDLLQKRETTIAQLTQLLENESTLSSSAMKQNSVSSFSQKLSSHKRDLVRLRSNLQHTRDHANLLSNVRSDIDQYRANNPEAAEAEYMLGERRRIDNSNSMIDNTLGQAMGISESFVTQRETIANINRRITLAANQVPGLNSIIGKISAKKRRDGIIMGSFIAFCFVVFWFFL
jgi:Golgi SNAP receptor complex protein 1